MPFLSGLSSVFIVLFQHNMCEMSMKFTYWIVVRPFWFLIYHLAEKNIFANGIWQIKLNDLPLKLKQTIVIEFILHRSVKLLFVFNIFHIRTQTVYLREHFKICVAAIIGRGIAWQVLSFFPAKQFNLGLVSKDVWIMPVIFVSASYL